MAQEKHWYIAIVAPNTEKVSAEKLREDYEVYLPSQKVVSVWRDGRKKVRERILLPGKILIYCTEQERRQSLMHSFLKRYMVDIASSPNEFGRRKVAIVPDDQVEVLKFVLGQSDVNVSIDNTGLQVGENVRVVRGPLCGLEGVVSGLAVGKPRLHISIDHLGCASVEVSLDDIERS